MTTTIPTLKANHQSPTRSVPPPIGGVAGGGVAPTHMTTSELIRSRIQELHEKGSGDWQSLMRQVDDAYRTIPYNTAQMLSLLIGDHMPGVKNVDLEWGRGTGKTTVLAAFARRIARDLPRGAYQWEVPTYQKFLTEIIPAFIHGLEKQGLYKDLHYFIGRRPPARWGWPEPYKPPVRYDNFVIFWNGFGINLLSQDNAGAGRGLSTDGRFASEATMLDCRKLDEESGPAIRGSNVKALGNRRYFNFRIMESSTPLTETGEWFIQREDMARQDKKLHQFLRANCVENITLGWLASNYLEESRRTAVDQMTFEAEYLNVRPKFVRGGFYALLDEARHTYTNFDYTGFYQPELIGVQPDCRGDKDHDPTLPLTIGMDFGAAINCLTVSQTPPGEFRTIKDFFVKGAEGDTQDELCQAFHEYYKHRMPHNKEIRYYHDATGNHSTGNTKLSRAQQAERYLTNLGWAVRRLSLTGTNPRHFDKYRLWERMFKEDDPRLPRFRINRQNARTTYISMTRAKKKMAADGSIKKDKSGERHDNPNRQYATDLSDAQDNPVFTLYNHLMSWFGGSGENKSATSPTDAGVAQPSSDVGAVPLRRGRG